MMQLAEGIYKGKGFQLGYFVTKCEEGYEVYCPFSRKMHLFVGEERDKCIKNFLSNHELWIGDGDTTEIYSDIVKG